MNAPGDIKRLSVAVLLDSNDANLVAQQPAIEQMVRAAIGYNSTRGDTVTVDLLPFDNQLAQEASALKEAQRRDLYMDLARLGAAILGVLLLIFFVRRTFRRLEELVFVDLGPAPIPRLEGPATIEVPATTGTLLGRLAVEEEPAVELDLREVRRHKQMIEVAKEQPDTIARVVQRWLAEA